MKRKKRGSEGEKERGGGVRESYEVNRQVIASYIMYVSMIIQGNFLNSFMHVSLHVEESIAN